MKFFNTLGGGVLLVALSGFTFSAVGFFASFLSGRFNPYWMTFIRFMVQALIAVAILLLQRKNIIPREGDRLLAFARCFCGCIAMTGVYFSLTHMELSDATSIFFSNPVWTAILAAVILKEKFGLVDFFGLCATVTGVVLVTRPAFIFGDDNHSTGTEDKVSSMPLFIPVLTAVGASFAASFSYLTVRKLKHLHPMMLTWLFGLLGSLTSIVLVAIQGGIGPDSSHSSAGPSSISVSDMTISEWSMLLGMGLCGVLGQGLVMKGMQFVPAGPASAIRTNDVAFAFMWQTLVEQRPAPVTSVLGALCIASYTIVLSILKCRKKKPLEDPDAQGSGEVELVTGKEDTAVLLDQENSDTDDDEERGSRQVVRGTEAPPRPPEELVQKLFLAFAPSLRRRL